ncbi:MAG: hypothetical protein GF375_02485 [Candidatus Omnitrophica bacterium]|nr:hypothetical protein [Candidatus Omnitrophota bacterium]MBD3268968.1 hypothetical protein [Candidatus Omnitrophota bacterium]
MKKTPTEWTLIVFSWIIFFGGIGLSVYYFILQWKLAGLLSLLGGIVAAGILRLLAHITGLVYNLCSNSFEILLNLKNIAYNTEKNSLSLQNIDSTLQHINCDSRDLNRNLYDLTEFLEEIKTRLSLKK